MKSLFHDIFKVLIAILRKEAHIMSAISDFKASQDAFNARMDAAVVRIQAEIAALQVGQGLSADDQAALDALNAHAATLADSLDAIAPAAAPAAAPAP